MVKDNQVQQVTRKDSKKVEVGKRLAESNKRKREEHAWLAKAQRETSLACYGAGAVVAVGVLGVISYYVYQSKTPKDKPKESLVYQPKEAPLHRHKETPDKFSMD